MSMFVVWFAHQMGQLFQFATRQFSEAESSLTTVERINAPVPQEPEVWRAPESPEDIAADHPPKDTPTLDEGAASTARSLPVTEVVVPGDWPSGGAVDFIGVSVRYRPGLPLALRDVSFRIAAGHRVGTWHHATFARCVVFALFC